MFPFSILELRGRGHAHRRAGESLLGQKEPPFHWDKMQGQNHTSPLKKQLPLIHSAYDIPGSRPNIFLSLTCPSNPARAGLILQSWAAHWKSWVIFLESESGGARTEPRYPDSKPWALLNACPCPLLSSGTSLCSSLTRSNRHVSHTSQVDRRASWASGRKNKLT